MATNKTEVIDEQESKIILKNDRLELGILIPGQGYTRPRFEWSGFVTDIILDGQHRFDSTHNDAEGNFAGRGLCNEFGMVLPIGKESTESFPKIGIGLIPAGVDERQAILALEAMTLYPKTYEVSEDSVTFTTKALESNGYATDYSKTIRIKDNKIIIDYTLKNVGTKAIHTEEYCHNFVRIGDKKIGPDYKLETSFDVEVEVGVSDLTNVFTKNDKVISWKNVPQSVYFFREDVESDKASYWWQLTDQSTGVSIKEFGDFKPYLFAVWGESYVVSPEVFVEIKLEAGETKSWQRCYELNC